MFFLCTRRLLLHSGLILVNGEALMSKATFIGTVVAGNSQQEAVASFLETINKKHSNKKAVFATNSSKNAVFLTSLSNLAMPYSPTTGESSCVAVMRDNSKISSKLQLLGTGEMLASSKFELVSCTCPECEAHIVSDSPELVAHCIVCGSEQSAEDEGEDTVDVRIAPESSDSLSSDSQVVKDLLEVLSDCGISTDADTLEALISGDGSKADEHALQQLHENVIELIGEDAFNKAEADGTIAEAIIDSLIGESEIGASVNISYHTGPVSGEDEKIDEFDSLTNPIAESSESDDLDVEEFEENSESESEYEDEEFENSDYEDDESYSADDLAEEDVEIKDDELDSLIESALAEDGFAEEEESFENDLEDTMEVDMLVDNIGASASVASNNVELVFSPSQNIGETKWYAVVNQAPVAVATLHSVGEEKSSIFTTDSFRKGTETLMAQMGVSEGLMNMGFKPMKIRLPVKNVVQSHVAQALASTQEEHKQRLESVSSDIRAALSTAAVGINKGFFSDITNPVKVDLYTVLSSAGVKNAEVLIDNAFANSADDYHRVLLAKAFDLMQKPVEARNEISQAVKTAAYQRVSSGSDSLSSSVSTRLSTIGRNSNGTMVASAMPSKQESNQLTSRIAGAVGSLIR